MRRLLTFIAAGALILAACGGDVGDGGAVTTLPETSTTAPSTTLPEGSTTTPGETTVTTVGERTVTVYFIQDGEYAKAVTRTVPGTLDVAANAIEALIAGPTAAETEDGLGTAIPLDTLLLGIDIADGVATVDLSSEFEQGGGSFAMFSRLGQVVYTLTEFDTIDRVVFWLDGQPVTVFSGEGILLDGPVDRSDYESALPLTSPAEMWGQGDLPSIDGVQRPTSWAGWCWWCPTTCSTCVPAPASTIRSSGCWSRAWSFDAPVKTPGSGRRFGKRSRCPAAPGG
jgi:spore germination protein GerM